MQKEQDRSKIDETGLQYHDMKMEYDHMATKVEELREKTYLQEAEINNLRACIKCEKMPEGYDVNDDATTELAVELAKSQLETSCLVEDVVHIHSISVGKSRDWCRKNGE